LASLVSGNNEEVVTYLDDTLIWMPANRRDSRPVREQAQSVLNGIMAAFRTSQYDGLSLNIGKCSIHTTQELQAAEAKFSERSSGARPVGSNFSVLKSGRSNDSSGKSCCCLASRRSS
jgi:hypothetical protein